MPRYRLRIPQNGSWIHDDSGGSSIVADSIEQARELIAAEQDAWPILLHSEIGTCQILRKRDIDSGDGHDGAEPGDTTVIFVRDHGGELRDNQVRLWRVGAPVVSWHVERLTEPVPAELVIAGLGAHHTQWGSGQTLGPMSPGNAVECRFDGETSPRLVPVEELSLDPTWDWPPRDQWPRYALYVEGQLVGASADSQQIRRWREQRASEVTARWTAEQWRALTRLQPIAA